jgi:hypothetical protein
MSRTSITLKYSKTTVVVRNTRNIYKSTSAVTIDQTGSGAHPASFAMVTGISFPGAKRPRRDADHSPPSSAVVTNEWSYTSPPPIHPSWSDQEQFLRLYLTASILKATNDKNV